MVYSNQQAVLKEILGSSLSGSDGATNRTYTLSDSNVIDATLRVMAEGSTLQYTQQYTLSNNIITFLIAIDDSMHILLTYDKSVPFTFTSPSDYPEVRYASTLQLSKSLGIKSDVPTWDVGSTPTKETVGTGDSSTTVFYLDHRYIINGTLTLYYGSSQSTTTYLTETTHYAIDLGIGKITLNSTGLALVGTDTLYAEYSYNSNGMTDAFLESTIKKAELEVDNLINSTFTDSTVTNPDYPSIEEYKDTEGYFNTTYFTKKQPLIDISSTLASDITSSDTSITLASGDGSDFPSTGTIVIGTEKVTYTGVSTDTLTGCSRGVDDSTAASHSSGDSVHTTVVEVSGTNAGNSPTYVVLEWDVDMAVTTDGAITLFNTTAWQTLTTTTNVNVKSDIPRRLRLSYLYGYDIIPQSINRLTLLLAKRILVGNTILNTLIKGRDEFNPSLVGSEAQEIKQIVSAYIVYPMGNT